MKDDLFFACRECAHKTHQRRDHDDAVVCLNCKLVTPVTIHGYTVIAAAPAPGGNGTRVGRVLLIDKGADNGSPSRWITSWQGRDLEPGSGWDREWAWGHYFDDKALAEADFEMRKARGY